jgi:hypothetical protein
LPVSGSAGFRSSSFSSGASVFGSDFDDGSLFSLVQSAGGAILPFSGKGESSFPFAAVLAGSQGSLTSPAAGSANRVAPTTKTALHRIRMVGYRTKPTGAFAINLGKPSRWVDLALLKSN